MFSNIRCLKKKMFEWFKIFLEISWNSGKISSISVRKITLLAKNMQLLTIFHENHQNFTKFWQNFDKFLTKFWIWSGAKECTSCRSRKMLKNAPTLAIVAVHTAENGPPKVDVWCLTKHQTSYREPSAWLKTRNGCNLLLFCWWCCC